MVRDHTYQFPNKTRDLSFPLQDKVLLVVLTCLSDALKNEENIF